MNSQKDPHKGGVCHFWHKANCLSGLVELDIITPVQPITRVWGGSILVSLKLRTSSVRCKNVFMKNKTFYYSPNLTS